MALPPYRVIVNTFESKPWPVVTHIFHGETLEQAVGFYRAHKKADAFMRGCGDEGNYDGKVRCTNKIAYQKRNKKKWITLREIKGK